MTPSSHIGLGIFDEGTEGRTSEASSVGFTRWSGRGRHPLGRFDFSSTGSLLSHPNKAPRGRRRQNVGPDTIPAAPPAGRRHRCVSAAGGRGPLASPGGRATPQSRILSTLLRSVLMRVGDGPTITVERGVRTRSRKFFALPLDPCQDAARDDAEAFEGLLCVGRVAFHVQQHGVFDGQAADKEW